jgi:hypothetical protein
MLRHGTFKCAWRDNVGGSSQSFRYAMLHARARQSARSVGLLGLFRLVSVLYRLSRAGEVVSIEVWVLGKWRCIRVFDVEDEKIVGVSMTST